MERSRRALALMLAFAGCTVAAIVLAGSRPASAPGVLPWAVQVVGYGCGIAAGVLLLVQGSGQPRVRRVGAVLMPALVALLLLDAFSHGADPEGADIGAGLLRLLLLVVIAVATVVLARVSLVGRRAR